MSKFPRFVLSLMVCALILVGCDPQTTPETDRENSVVSQEETQPPATKDKISASSTLTDLNQGETFKKYKLIAPDSYAPVYLELNPDQSFSMDFNYCQGVARADGSYTVENQLYFLEVKSSADLPSLNTIKLELKDLGNDQLQVVSEVYRVENGEKAYFCTPSNDPNDQFEGEEYNIYQLVD